ncbi:polyhomeotic-like protein 2 isoform X1 [Rhea pennata]|uniref:polyhomeotic-like protein 2 isoform X1 n=2 Tax=Rhea pennata TaxID=8795 RepID=UPI002E262893
MENEQLPAPAASSAAAPGATPGGSAGSGRPPGPQISVYSGIPDRQTVQVIQQALHRQPNTAAQYLQQMYAAQQQHLMLQTAALQQQHLTSAQLQSLAAVQQASLAANRQSGPSGGTGPPPPPPPAQQPTINLAAAPAAAQLINRAQSVNSAAAAASGIAQQAVLLGNAASPALTASQAQMYLRAQMLIFTPTATVTAVRPESPAAPAAPPPASAAQVSPRRPVAPAPRPAPPHPLPLQVQNLALRPAAAPHLPALAMKPPGPPKPAAPKAGPPEPPADHLKKGDAADARAHPLARAAPAAAAHPLIAPAYAQLQPHQFLQQQQKQIQHQFVIQQQQLAPRGQPQLIQGGSSPAPPLQPLPSPGPSLAPLQSPGGQQKSGGGTAAAPGPAPAAPAAGGAEGSAPNGPGGCPGPGAPRKYQHASAVILQLQPAGGTALAEGARHDPPPAGAPPPPLPAARSPPAAPPEPQEPRGERPAAHETGPERVHAQPAGPGMTSGTGSSAAAVAAAAAAPHNGENKPPQAIVKPQILTHVIEGFVIQEGAEPFPVGRSSLLVGSLKQKYAQELLAEKLPPPDNATTTTTTTTTTDSDMEEPYAQEPKEEGNPPKLKCELCGRVDFAYKFKRSKRFCSMACAKRYNVGCTKRVGLFHPDRSKLQKPGGPPHGRRRTCKGTLPALSKDTKKQSPVSLPTGSVPLSVTTSLQLNHSQEDSSRCSDNSSYEEPLSPISASSSTSRRRQGDRDLELRDMELPDMHMRDLAGIGHRFLPSEPSKWNVEDVYEFIRSLPGCQEIAEEFRAQEIDGQALLLLKEDHLMSTMNIKLGPALKIYARISMLKDS